MRKTRMPMLLHLVLVMLLSIPLFTGCGSRKAVQIPQEYRSPPPSRQAKGKPGVPPPAGKSPAVSQDSGQGPILSAPPAIREKDLSESVSASPPGSEEKKAGGKPQRLASMHLVDQAKTALAKGKPDQAIPLLEQAVQVDVYNGDAFLQLSRAWRMKGSRAKALEFAKKGEILLQDQPAKLKEVYLLQADLYKEGGDLKKSQAYLQKAGSLR